jgi:hypothetical protein
MQGVKSIERKCDDMKRIIEDEGASRLDALLGEQVLLLCANYFYTGKLTGVNEDSIELTNPAIVYETGKWEAKGYIDAQPLHVKTWNVRIDAIESFGMGK